VITAQSLVSLPTANADMCTGTYSRPALALDQLVDRLADRGLAIPDRERATRYLRHLGYYRLSPYMIPFQLFGADHQFRPDVAFDDVLDLYVFDRSLRLLVLDALERIEVGPGGSRFEAVSRGWQRAAFACGRVHCLA
jgi:hypothetical protein